MPFCFNFLATSIPEISSAKFISTNATPGHMNLAQITKRSILYKGLIPFELKIIKSQNCLKAKLILFYGNHFPDMHEEFQFEQHLLKQLKVLI